MPVPWASDTPADALEAVGEISVSPLGVHLSAEGPALVNRERVGVVGMLFWELVSQLLTLLTGNVCKGFSFK